MSRILKTLVVVATLASGAAVAHADTFTPHGVWDMIDARGK